MIRVLTDAGNAAIWISSVGIVVWMIQYTALAPWWKDTLGVTLIGEAVVILLIYIPTLMALADPAGYANFAQARWYLYLTVAIVLATALFVLTRIVVWERTRRQRRHAKLSGNPPDTA